jgi:hypothetical protein
MNIGNFVGTWYIQYKSGVEGAPLQNGWILEIGTGRAGAQSPFLTEEYAVCVGFALIDPQNPSKPVVLSTEGHDGDQPALLRLTGDQLRWKGYYNQQPAYIYIAVAETWTPGGESYSHLFGSTTFGDPEQIAVWGGSGTPPPPPSPKEGESTGG